MNEILTGKAKEHFEAWATNSHMHRLPSIGVEYLYPLFLNALIIEWLDSVGIYISITTNGKLFQWSINKFIGAALSRREATEAAILTANNLYNDTAK